MNRALLAHLDAIETRVHARLDAFEVNVSARLGGIEQRLIAISEDIGGIKVDLATHDHGGES